MSEKIEDQNNQSKVSTWLRDPIWQFVGALLAAVGIFIAIFLPLISGQKREISVKTSFSTILSAKEDLIDPDVKIIYKGNEVKKSSHK